uniref:Uncharacterized protein n=1 Tax=Emiliania huxleyi TaxID=2903 RepID=A0A7S3SB14_EMIHU|mmetsp:Transcript_16666/g.49372  ORF Transcript_16666/g.49372 Transcript_16666/m.49372 type:complete len:325 (-) Transcript_16666:106-1080(-)
MMVWPLLLLCGGSHAFGSISPSVDKVIYIIRHGEKIARNSGSLQRPEAVQCLSEKGWGRSYNLKSVFGYTFSFNGCMPGDSCSQNLPPLRTPDALFSANYADGPIDCKDEQGRYRTEQTIAALANSGPTSLNLPINNRLGFMPQLCGAGLNASFVQWLQAGGGAEIYSRFLATLEAKRPVLADDLTEAISGWLDQVPTQDAAGAPSSCVPYQAWGDDPMSGMCCNRAAAEAIKLKLLEPGVDTILVAWEHINIQWLALALGAPKGKVLDSECGGECWPGDDYDIIYELRYVPDVTGRVTVNTHLHQGYEWIGNQTGTCGAIAEA